VPEKAFEKLNKRIRPEWKICFFATLTVGLLAHIYKLTNWLPNWDGLVFRYDAQNMIRLGRWFLPVVCAFGSFYDLPFLSGIAAVLFHALGAVCICSILNVKKGVTAGLIGAVTVSFPAVVSVMMYSYVADGYAIAFFMACLAAYFMTANKPRYIAATCLIMLSVGVYQAYVTVTVMLVLLKLADELVFGKKEAGFVLKRALICLAVGIAGMVLYYAVLTLILKLTGTELLDYQGMNSAASGLCLNLPGSFYVIKETLLNFFFNFSSGVSAWAVINVCLFAFAGVMYVRYAAKAGIFTSPFKLLMLFAIGVFLLMGSTALAFINSAVDYHNLMLVGYCVFYIFFIILYERGREKSKKAEAVRSWGVLGLTLVLIFNQVVTANVSWHKAQLAYEKSYGVLVRIADRIEQTEGAQECNEILVVGALKGSEAYSALLPPDITGITDGYIIRADDETVGQSVLCAALNDYCHKDYSFVSGKRKQKLLKTEKAKSMSSWPYEGCVDVIDGVVVIRLGD